MNILKTIDEIRSKLNALQDALSVADEAKDETPAPAADKSAEQLTTIGAQSSRKIELLIVHSTATPASMDIGVDKIAEWHKARGFRKVGYHYVIKRNGTVQHGRREYEPGAHAKGHNKRSIGVALVGGARKRNGLLRSDRNFTKAQYATLRQVILEMRAKYPGIDVCGHRDLPGAKTVCPSFDVKSWWADV